MQNLKTIESGIKILSDHGLFEEKISVFKNQFSATIIYLIDCEYRSLVETAQVRSPFLILT